jgi:hypothetical protein
MRVTTITISVEARDTENDFVLNPPIGRIEFSVGVPDASSDCINWFNLMDALIDKADAYFMAAESERENAQ